MKIVILDGHAVNPGDLGWDALRSYGSLEVFDRTPENLIVPRAREAEALLTTRVPLSAQTLTQLKQLRYVGAIFTGYDEIDLKAARELNLIVTNVPTYGTASVAQLVLRSSWNSVITSRCIARRLMRENGRDARISASGKRP
jgi:glycerate dehydrogenase